MSHKSGKIAELIASFQGRDLDAHYLGYFECFNRQMFYDAHDVLEVLWLGCRKDSSGDYYKGLIQLAGAFVHLQKCRRNPAMSLLGLAYSNLSKYTPIYQRIDVEALLRFIQEWTQRLQAARPGELPSFLTPPPRLATPDSVLTANPR